MTPWVRTRHPYRFPKLTSSVATLSLGRKLKLVPLTVAPFRAWRGCGNGMGRRKGFPICTDAESFSDPSPKSAQVGVFHVQCGCGRGIRTPDLHLTRVTS
jgi:hypothetical protein